MEKILVPIDFSKQSEYAIKLAAKIAKKTKSNVHLLHVIELPSGMIDMASGSSFSIPESMLYMKSVKNKVEKIKANFFDENTTVHSAIHFQNPHQEILDYSEKIDASLIVMGSKGISDFDEILIGSNTEKVVRTSKIPVLVAKKETENFEVNNVIFASNFKEENKKSFQKFLNFAAIFESKIHLLKVITATKFEDTKTSREQIENFIADFNITNYTVNIYNDFSIEKGIMNFAQDIDADLIAISTHGKSGLSQMFNGSVSKSLTKSALRPVITFKV